MARRTRRATLPWFSADFHKANRPPVWGHTRWQRGRGGSARRGDRTPSRPSPLITAAPVLTFFTTNYMGTGCVATPSTRAVNGGVIREKDEKSAGHPPAMRRPAARPDAKRLHNDVARRSSAAFPSVSQGRSLAAKIGVSGSLFSVTAGPARATLARPASAVSYNVRPLGERLGDPPMWLPALEPEPEFWRRARCGRSCR